jgi:8-amino-7-oxononanoate synthase
MQHNIEKFLEATHAAGLHRRRQLTDFCLHNFSSSDYLALSLDNDLQKHYQDGFASHAVGSTSSALLNGYAKPHQDLEQYFAKILGVEAALLFSTGYVANLSLVNFLAQVAAHLLIDKFVHASIYDGIKFSGIKYKRYKHNNIQDLASKRALLPTSQTVVITEGIFSMTGQIAKLDEISRLGCHLVVDEAHAFGVVGPQGLGTIAQFSLNKNVPLRLITFGKAMAGSGAIIAGDAVWLDALLQCARPYIYSTAISPAYAYGLRFALDKVLLADARRAYLQELISYFRDKVKDSNLVFTDSITPIQQLKLSCPQQALKCAEFLRVRGIICFAIRQPTVSKQDTGLRIILNYNHTSDAIDALFLALNNFSISLSPT